MTTLAPTPDLADLDVSDLDLWKDGPPHEIFDAPARRGAAALERARRLPRRGRLLVGRPLRRHRRGRPRSRDVLVGAQHHPRRQARVRPGEPDPMDLAREHDDHAGPAAPRPSQGAGPARLHAEAGARSHRADARDHQPGLRPRPRGHPDGQRRPRPRRRRLRARDGDRRHARRAARGRRAAGRLDQPHHGLPGPAPGPRPRRCLAGAGGVHALRQRDDRASARPIRPTT